MILQQGIHDAIPMGAYLADCAPEPSLSTGIVETLFEKSPAHAFRKHPRLGNSGSEATSRGDLGSAIHSLVFGGAPVEYVGEVAIRSGPNKGEKFIAADWKTKDAKDARDAIRTAGGLPMLEHQRTVIEGCAAAARKALEPYGPGKAEQTLVWEQSNVWARGRADWLTDDGRFDIDLKTCDDADPKAWTRRCLFPNGLDIQAGLRVCGHEAITGRTRDVLFLLVELEPPYAASFVGVHPSTIELARRKIAKAASIWERCLRTNEWPGYTSTIHWAAPPAYVEWDVEERTMEVAS